MQRVDGVVSLAHFAAERSVSVGKSLQRIAEHRPGAARHVLQLRAWSECTSFINQAKRGFGDVYRVVADSLEVAGHLDRPDDRSEISRHWLLQREQCDCKLLDFDFQRVQRLVTR